jgi:sec-independent protein translocase protein TatA
MSPAVAIARRAPLFAAGTLTATVIQSAGSAPDFEGVAMIGRLGLPELVIILFIIIMIFGANRLPEIGRGIGKGIRNFKESNAEGAKRDDD